MEIKRLPYLIKLHKIHSNIETTTKLNIYNQIQLSMHAILHRFMKIVNQMTSLTF